MPKHFRLILALIILAIVMLACASPITGGETPASSSNAVATVVAQTLRALTPVPEGGTTPEATDESLLPRTFYYLGTDSAGLTQVFRIEKDGKTTHQVTSETVNVGNYDVSPVDGSVAYIVNNQIFLINADGSEPHMIVDGGPVAENAPYTNNVSNPVFAPNGKTLAYGHQGLSFYSLESNISNRVLENQLDNISGLPIPRELYSPDKYSPDGSKLLLTLGYYEGASAAIYYPNGNALVRLSGGEGALICCGEEEWTPDGSAFYAANPSMGMLSSGMWKVDSTTGAVTTLIPGDAGAGMYNIPDEAFLAPDRQLYYFFAKVSAPDGFVTRAPLKLVRSGPDGVTGRTVISEENFQLLNEALWALDASLVVVAYAPIQEVYQGGQAEVVYLDGRPPVVLTTFAQQMKWGP